jgi:hypothetical protein
MLGALVLLALAGCFSERPQQAALFDARPRFTGPTGDDVVHMDVAFIERPAPDRYLDRDLWADADEQTIEPEKKVVLHDNGFRVGQLGGLLPPGELQELLTSPRSCVEPRRISLHARQATTLVLGPVRKKLQVQLVRNGRQVPVELENAQCTLEVMPELTDDGRTTLRCTPHIRHGLSNMGFAPLRDDSGALRWERQEQRPEEVYSWLSWEVTVSPNEYVVIGTNLDHLNNLGQRCFLAGEDGPRLQRLLVLRTSRTISPRLLADDGSHRVAELAEQAQGTTARGKGE